MVQKTLIRTVWYVDVHRLTGSAAAKKIEVFKQNHSRHPKLGDRVVFEDIFVPSDRMEVVTEQITFHQDDTNSDDSDEPFSEFYENHESPEAVDQCERFDADIEVMKDKVYMIDIEGPVTIQSPSKSYVDSMQLAVPTNITLNDDGSNDLRVIYTTQVKDNFTVRDRTNQVPVKTNQPDADEFRLISRIA